MNVRRRCAADWSLALGMKRTVALLIIMTLAALVGCREAAITPQQAAATPGASAASTPQSAPPGERENPETPSAPFTRPPQWKSPTSGPPLELGHLLPGVQAVLHWRVADSLVQPELGKVLDSLGPWGELARKELPRRSGVPLADIETLLVGFYGVEQGPPDSILVLRLRTRAELATLAKNWSGATVDAAEARAYRAGEFGYWLPESQEDRLLVVCPADWLNDVVTAAGATPTLRRELELLRAASDDQRQFTFLFAPNFLATGGKGLLAGEAEGLRDPLDRLLGPFPRGAMFCADLRDALFVELAVYASADQKPLVQERNLRRRWQELPTWADEYLSGVELSSYNRPVLERLPSMLDVLVDFTRSDVEDRIVRLRAYLPAVAAHNLALAGRLALEAGDGSGAGPASPTDSTTSDLAARLARPLSLKFPRTPLDKALELFGAEADVDVEIAGDALQREGITKNQMLSIDVQDRPAGEVLAEILRLANADGKLMYIVQSRDDGSGPPREVLVVTTKAAAKAGRAR